jgi:hypothetical protein
MTAFQQPVRWEITTNMQPLQAKQASDPGGRLEITPEAGAYYLAACEALLTIIDGRTPVEDDLFHISEAQGMFGRTFILGQRDRLAVSAALGNPTKSAAQSSRNWLKRLRKTLKKGEDYQTLLKENEALSTSRSLIMARDFLVKLGFVASPKPLRD